MKISHELPPSLLQYGYEFNDYDYMLPCFIDKYPLYKIYFKMAKADNRFIIMDNSLFEGYNHTNDELLEKIHKWEPDIFIVPDVWNDSTVTIRNAKHWMMNYKKYLSEKTNLMAVLQGNNFGELLTTYQILVDLGYKHIAFNHSSAAYQTIGANISTLDKQMVGRHYLINKLLETNTMNQSYYHHLLGCSLPQEVMLYKSNDIFKYDCLKSIDTSSPIINGALGIRYKDNGLKDKPKEKIEEFFEKDLIGQIEDIRFNVQKFKSYDNEHTTKNDFTV
jgi:hypothetical protein